MSLEDEILEKNLIQLRMTLSDSDTDKDYLENEIKMYYSQGFFWKKLDVEYRGTIGLAVKYLEPGNYKFKVKYKFKSKVVYHTFYENESGIIIFHYENKNIELSVK